jgi:hypothetical protein
MSLTEETAPSAPAEPVVGREAAEVAAGFQPYKPEPETPEEPDIKLADWAKSVRERELDAAPAKSYGLPSDMPENGSWTVEQAAKHLSEARAAEASQAQSDADAQLAAEIDAVRGEQQPSQPDAENPAFKEAVEKEAATKGEQARVAAEQAQAQYLQGLSNAKLQADASFLQQFPEFTHVPPNQREQAFHLINQHNPARGQQILNSLNQMGELVNAFNQEASRQGAQRDAMAREYAKTESAKFEDMIKGDTANRSEIESEIIAAIQEYGGNTDEFIAVLQRPEFRNAAVQRLLWDVGKLRMMAKSPAKAIPQPVPPVTKPGTSTGRSTARAESIEGLQRQLQTATGNNALKIAAKLTAAKRSRNG